MAPTSDGFFKARGARLEYQYWCGDKNTTLVLLHEGLGCLDLWRDVPDKLNAATGCPVLAYSRTGYGRSDRAGIPRSPMYMHDEALKVLPTVLDQAGVERPLLVGHSDGASIALIYAGSEFADGLVGVSTLAPHVFVEDCTLDGIRAARSAYLTSALRDRLMRYHGERVDNAFWGWNQIWLSSTFRAWNIEAYLPNVRVPVQVIQGIDDAYGTLEQLQKMESGLIQPIEQHVFDRCGHAPHRDRSDETFEAIIRFVALCEQQ